MADFLRSRSFRIALTAAALAFMGWSAWKLASRWQEGTATVDLPLAACAFAAMLLAVFAQSLAWSLLIATMLNVEVPLRQLLSAHVASGLGKYMPGKVGQPVMRIAALSAYHVPPKTVVVSMAVEILSWAATGAATTALLLAFGSGLAEPSFSAFSVPAAVAAVGAVVALGTVSVSRYPEKLRSLLGLDGHSPILSFRVPVVHTGSWLLWALHAVLLSKAVGAQGTGAELDAAAFFVLAPIAGFLALPMPAGVGVRESVMALGLAPHVGAGGALAAALLSRAASLAADIVLWLALSRKNPTKSSQRQ